MTAPNERLIELLADRAAVGLSAREQIELAELLVHAQDVDAGAFDRAASAIALASVGRLEKMPTGLADRLEKAALGALESRPASDFMRTRELDKLSPPLVSTQIDPVSVQFEPGTFDSKKTQAMSERPVSAPARPLSETAPAESIATMLRPVNDGRAHPPQRHVGTSPAPFRPASAPSLAPAEGVGRGQPMPYPTASSAPYGATSTAPPSNVVPLLVSERARRGGTSRVLAIGGWVAAAACLLLAIGAFVLRATPGPVVTLPMPAPTTPTVPSATTPAPSPTTLASLSPAELRDKLRADEGSSRAEWTPTKDPLGKAATGEVVWNKDQQKGTMRFKGLAKNDPTRAQYQLWIFDKTRDEKYPVDGGVFDVDSDTGEVIVPIRATLAVNAPVLFAVTLEKPGGVVVSKREHIVVTAKMPAG